MKIDILNYFAGYLDGDGCFYSGKYIQKPKNIVVYEHSIQVVSVKKESLLFFKEKFGGNICEKPRRYRHKQPYCWTIKGKKSLALARYVYPFLKDKKNQCKYYIRLVETITPNFGIKLDVTVIQIREHSIKMLRKDKHQNAFVTQEKIELLKKLDIIQPSVKDFAYLAGLVDAEGCFRVKKWKPKNKPNYVYAINLEIGNNRFLIFEYLVTRFKGNIKFSEATVKKNACAIWSISSLALSKIILDILPFLTIKKEVAKKIIEFYATNLPNGGDRHSRQFKLKYQNIIIIREKIFQEIQLLNSKGDKAET